MTGRTTVAAALVLTGCDALRSQPAPPPDPAPPFTALDASGTTVDLDALRGRIVVLEFLTAWCPACKATAPHLQVLHDRFRDDPDIVLVAVRADDEGNMNTFMQDGNYTFRMVPEGAEIARQYGVTDYPTRVTIDGSGRMVGRHVGALDARSRDGFEGYVRALVVQQQFLESLSGG